MTKWSQSHACAWDDFRDNKAIHGAHLVALVGEEWHGCGHEVLADAVQHHTHRSHQALNGTAGLQVDFVEGIRAAQLQHL